MNENQIYFKNIDKVFDPYYFDHHTKVTEEGIRLDCLIRGYRDDDNNILIVEQNTVADDKVNTMELCYDYMSSADVIGTIPIVPYQMMTDMMSKSQYCSYYILMNDESTKLAIFPEPLQSTRINPFRQFVKEILKDKSFVLIREKKED